LFEAHYNIKQRKHNTSTERSINILPSHAATLFPKFVELLANFSTENVFVAELLISTGKCLETKIV